jgi:hypothetical protein
MGIELMLRKLVNHLQTFFFTCAWGPGLGLSICLHLNGNLVGISQFQVLVIEDGETNHV